MAVHSIWVHGNVARAQWVANPTTALVQGLRADGATGGVPWSDIVGLPQGGGITFRGTDRSRAPSGAKVVPLPSTYFHIPIPTPVVVNDTRATLRTIFVLWRAQANVLLQEVSAFDGPTELGPLLKVPVAEGRDGTGGFKDLIVGMTQFEIPNKPAMLFGLGIRLGFGFSADADVTFITAGADFEIADPAAPAPSTTTTTPTTPAQPAPGP